MRELEKRKEHIDNELKLSIGDHSYGAIMDGGEVVAGYSFREQTRAERVQRALKFRSLRQASPKTVGGILGDQMKGGDGNGNA